MPSAAKLAVLPANATGAAIDPADLLTADELAARLKVKPAWVDGQTRKRAKIRHKEPLPVLRLGKHRLFSWVAVSEWIRRNNA